MKKIIILSLILFSVNAFSQIDSVVKVIAKSEADAVRKELRQLESELVLISEKEVSARGTFNIDTLTAPTGTTVHYKVIVWVQGTLISAAKQCWVSNNNDNYSVRQINDAATANLNGMVFNIQKEGSVIVVKITDPSPQPNKWKVKVSE